MNDLWSKLKPGETAAVTLPDGSIIAGTLIRADFSGIKQSAEYTILDTESGKRYTAVMTAEDALKGTVPKAIAISQDALTMSIFDTNDAYVTGLKDVSGSFTMHMDPAGEKAFNDFADAQTPPPDLSQIAADLKALASKPGPVGKNGPIVNSSAQAKAFYDNLMKQQLSPAAFAEHYLSKWGPPPKKPLKETLLDLVKQIGHELQKAPPEELEEFMKQPVAGMYVPIMPDFKYAPLAATDPETEPPTIKTLHIRLEVSK